MDSPLRVWRATLCHRPIVFVASLTLLIASGCRRSEPLEWDPPPEAAELREDLQQQSRDVVEFYGGDAKTLKLLTWQPTLKHVSDWESLAPEEQQRLKAEQDRDIEKQRFIFEQHLKHGQAVYMKRCVQCHGEKGDGNGPAADHLYPRPRDYTKGIFKFTSTPYGAKPRRDDLVRTLQKGITGTSMPAFNLLPDEDIEAVVDYIILIAQRSELETQILQTAVEVYEDEELISDSYLNDRNRYFLEDNPHFVVLAEDSGAEEDEDAGSEESDEEEEEIYNYEEDIDFFVKDKVRQGWLDAEAELTQPLTPQPQLTAEHVVRGRAAFLSKGCSKCHGEDGRGHTRDNIGKDVWGNATRAADLTSGMLHGGQRPIDIYRRILNGINGTPMPGFKNALASEPDTIWDLVSYVLEVSGRRRDMLTDSGDNKRPPIPAGLIKPYKEPQPEEGDADADADAE